MSKAAHSIDRILSWATLSPWALEEFTLATIAGVLVRRMVEGAHALSAADLAALTGGPRTAAAPAVADQVAVIPLHGVIAPRITMLSEISGGATFEAATRAVNDAAADPQVRAIVLDINSPGGSVLGARVFARALLKARTVKPCIAQIEYCGCSAAYWGAACATEVVAAPGAQLGALGVYMIHDNISKLLADAGIERTLISEGDQKLDGHESLPLTDRAKARFQGLVRDSYNMFTEDVAAGRGRTAADVRAGFGTGSVVTVTEGLALGMVDREATLDETLARLGVAAPAPQIDTPQESALLRTTGQDRVRERVALEAELLALI